MIFISGGFNWRFQASISMRLQSKQRPRNGICGFGPKNNGTIAKKWTRREVGVGVSLLPFSLPLFYSPLFLRGLSLLQKNTETVATQAKGPYIQLSCLLKGGSITRLLTVSLTKSPSVFFTRRRQKLPWFISTGYGSNQNKFSKLTSPAHTF